MFFNEQKLYNILSQKLDREIPIHIFNLIPSTNQKLWELLQEEKTTPIAGIALQQTAGKGQWGRTWDSPLGGLYLSVAISPNIPVIDSFHLTLSTALGIVKNLRNEKIPVLIKWPNDLILEKRKLGGIKTEIKTKNDKITQAVIGVGINWQNTVPNTGINLKSFEISLEYLAAISIAGILSEYEHYLSLGIDDLLISYLKLLANLGQKITFEGNTGTIIGVTKTGELKVRLSSVGASTEINLSPGTISLGYDLLITNNE